MSNTARQIRQHINRRVPAGKAFSATTFRQYGSASNVRKILSRLTQAGTIKRVAPGLFAKPKQVPHIGETLPSPQEVVETIAQSTGEIIAIHGAEAARRLQLTTQTPMQPVFFTTGNTRQIKISNRTILLKHISPRKLVAPGTIVGTVISALWYFGQKNASLKSIHTIKKQLTQKEFESILQKIEYMPAWMADLFYQYQKELAANGR